MENKTINPEAIQGRFDVSDTAPKAYAAMEYMEKYIGGTSFDNPLGTLVRLHVSEIDGCKKSIQKYSEDALKCGFSEEKLFALTAWWESALFDDRERAVLAAVEDVTRISKSGLRDPIYKELLRFYTNREITQLVMLIGTTNLWNRLYVCGKNNS